MSLLQLRQEHASVRIGPTWLQEVARSCRSVTTSYAPEIYSHGVSWESGLEDLVQEVVTERLLAEGQAEYLATVALTIEDFRRLLGRQVRRTLAHRRRRTVIDQLIARSRDIFGSDPQFMAHSTKDAWTVAAEVRLDRAPTPIELRRAADRVRTIPVVRSTGTERAGAVYRTTDLRQLLVEVARSLPTFLRVRDLDRILQILLTPFLPGILDAGGTPNGGPPPTPEELHEMTTTAVAVFEALSPEQRVVLSAKLGGVADGEVARGLGMSRPTAAARKREMLDVVESRLRDQEDSIRLGAIEELSVRVAGLWPPAEMNE